MMIVLSKRLATTSPLMPLLEHWKQSNATTVSSPVLSSFSITAYAVATAVPDPPLARLHGLLALPMSLLPLLV